MCRSLFLCRPNYSGRNDTTFVTPGGIDFGDFVLGAGLTMFGDSKVLVSAARPKTNPSSRAQARL
jgi:hypothetical protein